MGLSLVGVLTLAFAGAAHAATTVPSAPDAGDWVTDGTVYAIAHSGGRTFIGGDFRHIGPRTGTGAPVGADGHVAGAFPEVAGGSVDAVAADGSGGWYIGGDFTSVGGVARSHLAHITSAGAVDTGFDPSPDGTVSSIVVGSQAPDTGAVYIGGAFTHVGHPAVGRQYAAAVCGAAAGCAPAMCGSSAMSCAAGSVLDWKPTPDGEVASLAEVYVTQKQADTVTTVNQPLVFVGGAFAKIGAQAGGLNIGLLAAVWGTGAQNAAPTPSSDSGVALNWNPSLGSTGSVRAIALQARPAQIGDTDAFVAVYAGGDFSLLGGNTGFDALQFDIPLAPNGTARSDPKAPGQYTAQYSVDGPACPNPAPEPCAQLVRSLALSSDGTALYVGGDFLKLGAVAAQRLGVVPTIADPGMPAAGSTLNPAPDWSAAGADAPVTSLATAAGGTLYVAGEFATLAGQPRSGAGALAANGTSLGWDPAAAGGEPDVVGVSGSTVYVGGAFTSLGARPIHNIAAIGSGGAYDSGWHGATDDGGVRALAVSGGALYAGGNFHSVEGGTTRNYVAAFSTSDGSLLGWDPNANGGVLALAVDNGTIYAGGAFTGIGGAARNHIAALDASGAAIAWDPGADNSVRAILPACGAVYVGGAFTAAGGQDRSRLAALDPTDGAALDWDPHSNSTVLALAAGPNRIYAGGTFAMVGGAARDGIAAIDSATAEVKPWAPSMDPAIVRALAPSAGGSTVFAGGSFLLVNGNEQARLAELDAITGAPTAWNPGADEAQGDDVYALAAAGGALYAGGAFRQIGTAMQQSFASFDDGAAGATATPACATPPHGTSSGSGGGSSGSDDSSGDSASPVSHLGSTTQTSTQEPAPAPTTTTAPSQYELTVADVASAPSRFWAAPTSVRRRHPHRRYGTVFSFTLSHGAAVTVVIERELFGRRLRGRCVAPGRSPFGARCARYQRYGEFERHLTGGAQRVPFSGHLSRGWLPPGVYTAKLTADDGAHQVTQLVRFQILGRR